MDSLLASLSAQMQSRVLLEEGQFWVSDELRGDPALLSFVGLAQRYGVKNVSFLDPRAFDDRSRRMGGQNADVSDSDVQEYALKLFNEAYNEGASDIHISNLGPYGIVRFRRMGMMKDHAKIPGALAQRLITVIYGTLCQSTSHGDYLPTERQDGRIADRQYLPAGVHSMRVHTEPLQSSLATDGFGALMPIRLLYDRTNATGTLEERMTTLGFDDADCKRFNFLTQRTGLSIISGPTGHGKSTVLKHIMEAQTSSHPEKSYMSLEDPTEYPMRGVQQIMVTTKALAELLARGRAYVDAIAGAMRSDPDVIMIGEIRYPEAAAAAIDAALTGHSVWATIHANNGFGIIRRMVSLLNAAHYADPLEYLCDHNVLAGLVYQRLLPVLCPDCKKPLVPMLGKAEEAEYIEAAVRKRLFSVVKKELDAVHVRNPEGCDHCNGLGIVGQTVAAEVIVTDQIMLEHLRQGNYSKAQDYWTKEYEGRTYVDHAVQLIAEGKIDPTQAETRLGVPLNFSKVHEQFTREDAA